MVVVPKLEPVSYRPMGLGRCSYDCTVLRIYLPALEPLFRAADTVGSKLNK